MTAPEHYPVHFQVTRPERCTRLQLALRLVAFLALGVVGLSFGMVFCFTYLVLPAYAASRIAAVGSRRYSEHDGPRVTKVLHWFAVVCGWAGLIVEYLPSRSPAEAVTLEVRCHTEATAGSALSRVITGIPSALVLMLLFTIGWFVWLWAALSILLAERIGPRAFFYLQGIQRWTIRLLAYQASLVDDYPPFSFAESGLDDRLPTARTVDSRS